MVVSFRKLIELDCEFVAGVLEQSFNEDSERAFGVGIKGGPPGYNDGTLVKRVFENNQLSKLVIQYNGIDCGVLVFQEGTPSVIEYFCVLPVYTNKGVGSAAWRQFEAEHSGIWALETPDYSKRNHHFYIKNGFIKISEKVYESGARSFVFQKDLGHS
ncbi:hypothetical protein IGI37_001810 [Enterococcus sp. AZ194]|uniref:GNAT family N-acetyltransferase n=1 Tax=Enterococcus sp. AZ194 TaxID=2774629 RepID=UPI003F224DBF